MFSARHQQRHFTPPYAASTSTTSPEAAEHVALRKTLFVMLRLDVWSVRSAGAASAVQLSEVLFWAGNNCSSSVGARGGISVNNTVTPLHLLPLVPPDREPFGHAVSGHSVVLLGGGCCRGDDGGYVTLWSVHQQSNEEDEEAFANALASPDEGEVEICSHFYCSHSCAYVQAG
jgi:hypothetical protein